MSEDSTLEQTDLYLTCLSQLANQKKIFKTFLETPGNLEMLPICLEKCMRLCNDWYKDEAELRLYTKIFSKKGDAIHTLGEAKEKAKNEK
jgi:hypothetical protein